MIKSAAQHTNQSFVSAFNFQAGGPYRPWDASYAGVDGVLYGDEVQHDTMPLYTYDLVASDFNVSFPH